MSRTLSKDDVAFVDDVAKQFVRGADRPDGKFVRLRLVDDQLTKAKQRLRTAVWRDANDRKGRPTSDQIGRALLMAVCTTRDFAKLLDADLSVVRRATDDMVARGFKLSEIHSVMRKIRWRHVDRGDRAEEESDQAIAHVDVIEAEVSAGQTVNRLDPR